MSKFGPKRGSKHPRKCTTRPGHSGFIKVWLQYVNNAKLRNIAFLLSKDELRHLTSQDCTYCGGAPSTISKTLGKTASQRCTENSQYIYNGVDRADSDMPYFMGNCVPCCKRCNFMKSDMTFTAFKNHIFVLYKNLSKGDI